MAPLAVIYKKMGWKVTGSDRAFFPPMSTYLEKNGIAIMPGFKKEHLKERPDLAVVMSFITKKNPELAFVLKEKIPHKSYSEILPELIEKKYSIVVAGSRGKTTVSALIAWILEVAGKKPSFMIGGIPNNFKDGMRKTSSEWSVLEGDEYPASNLQKIPKFLFYNPRYLVLTGATWDHVEQFPTVKTYRDLFKKLVKRLPQNGIVIANKEGEGLQEILQQSRLKIRWYECNSLNLHAPFAGRAWQENTAAAVALGEELGIPRKTIQQALLTFKGVKRRQEVRYQGKGITVIDDNAHSPEKVAGVLEVMRTQYPRTQIISIYEPGSRNAVALRQKAYSTAFALSDYVFLPRISSAAIRNAHFNELLFRRYASFYPHMEYISDDKEIVSKIKRTAMRLRKRGKRVVVIFMSQKGFRGMIEEVMSALQT